MTVTNKDPEVGYGRPPKAHQFKPGESGNPAGRPPKANSATLQIDLEATLEGVFGGQPGVQMGSYEREMRGVLKRALKDGHVPSIIRLLQEMWTYGVIGPKEDPKRNRPWELPAKYPHRVGEAIIRQYGPGPWPRRVVRPLIAEYLATRTEEEKIFDDIVEYDFDV